MPDEDFLRSTLRDQWHLVPTGITDLPGTVMSRAWQVAAGPDQYVVRLSEPDMRQPVEAGLAAAEHLRAHRIAAGQPVRTLSGALTVPVGDRALALVRRLPGRPLAGGDPVDQQFWGDRLGAVHRVLQGFHHPSLGPVLPLDLDAAHLAAEPSLREALADAVAAATRLTVTDRLTCGVLHGDPAPGRFVVDPSTGQAGVLDCGASSLGPLVADVAAAVAYAGGPEQAAELVDGYLAAGPVGPDELHAALPVLLRLRWAVLADRAARRGCAGALNRARRALASTAG